MKKRVRIFSHVYCGSAHGYTSQKSELHPEHQFWFDKHHSHLDLGFWVICRVYKTQQISILFKNTTDEKFSSELPSHIQRNCFAINLNNKSLNNLLNKNKNKMDLNAIKIKLNQAYEENGYFFELRNRKFNHEKGEKILLIFNAISFYKSTCYDKELVWLIWYLPLFLEYRITEFKESKMLNESDLILLENQCVRIRNEVERILSE